MPLFYPDNGNRRSRVEGLSTHINLIQDAIEKAHKAMEASDAVTLARLNKYANDLGYKSIDDCSKAAEDLLSPEQRELYRRASSIKNYGGNVLDGAERINRSLLAITGVAGFAIVVKLVFKNGFINAYRLIAAGFAKLVTNAIEAGMQLISAGIATIRGLATVAQVEVEAGTEAAVAGTELAVEASAIATRTVTSVAAGTEVTLVEGGLSLLKIGTLATLAASVVIEIGLLVYEGVMGHKQMVELQEWINKLVPSRFATAKMQMLVHAAVNCTAACNTLIDLETTLEPVVRSGKMGAEVRKQLINDKLKELDARWLKEHEGITEQAVMDSLSTLDKKKPEWTNEDPDIVAIREWLRKNPAFDPPSPKAEDMKRE